MQEFLDAIGVDTSKLTPYEIEGLVPLVLNCGVVQRTARILAGTNREITIANYLDAARGLTPEKKALLKAEIQTTLNRSLFR